MQIVLNGNSSVLRKRALRDPNYTLQDMIIDGRKAATNSVQASGIEERFTQEVHLNAVGRSQRTCYNCGFAYPHQAKPCPAKDVKNNFCSKKGHFSTACRKKSAQYRQESKENGKVLVVKLDKSRWSCPALNIEHRNCIRNFESKRTIFM